MNITFTRSSTIYDESRATKEIFAFLEKGYHVTVLGWDRSGGAEQYCEDLFRNYSSTISFKFYSGFIGNTKIDKILSRGKWNKWLMNELSQQKEIDVIHACDYDTGAAVRRFAKKNKIKYVYDIYDYYIDAHPVPGLLRNVIERDEIKTINESTVTIICTEERREQIKKANPSNVVVIHNSPDVEKQEAYDEEFDYVYCGSLYDGRLIGEILRDYQKHPEFKFVFAGSGKYASVAEELDKKQNHFTFYGSVPYSTVIDIEMKSKVISAIYEPTIRNHQLCAPNKFYEALALSKPLIVCRGTGIDKVVEENDIGIVINYDVNEFYEALQKLCSDEAVRLTMGIRAREIYDKKYKWSIMRQRLIQVYESL